jgi:molecular chaperone DnaK
MSKVIGIDLGTTNSCISIIEGTEATVISNPEGGRVTPSIVAVSKNGERLIGQVAKRQAITNPKDTIYGVKRYIGRRFSELSDYEKSFFPYVMKQGPKDAVVLELGGKEYQPPEISAMVLQYLRTAAEDFTGEKVTDAVLTVPAYFNDAQRQATKDAGRIAGLNVERIVNEPTAAALAFGLARSSEGKVAVFDLGGGTFDISILELKNGVFQVLATNGDTQLGGEDFDRAIMEWLVKLFKEKEGADLSGDRMAMQRLKEAAEKAKCELSSTMETNINLPFITADDSGPKHLDVTLSRAEMETLVSDLVKRTLDPCKQALVDAKIEASAIEEVILVGGSTRMPAVQTAVRSFFGREPSRSVNPDEVVAMGAAIQAGVLDGKVEEVVLLDVTPLSLGIETLGGVMTKLIERNTTIPVKKSQVFTTATDNQPAVNVHVLQGEREMARDNRTLARFDLVGIPAAPRGVPQVEVTFDIDANGIVSCSARDLGTGKEQKIQVQVGSGISEEEIGRMIEDAETHAEQDRSKRRSAEILNNAQVLLYSTERTLEEQADRIDEKEGGSITSALEELKDLLQAQQPDLDEIEKATETLSLQAHRLAELIYTSPLDKQVRQETSLPGTDE